MSQRVDFEEQGGYQVPSDYQGTLYQGQSTPAGVSAGSAGPVFAPPGMGEPAVSRHRLILAMCSLGALAVAVIAFISALEAEPYSSSLIVAALIGLGLVCASVVAINIIFHLRR